MKGRTITWLGVAAVVAILVATGVATAAAVRDAGRDADRERDALAERAVGALATEVRAAKNAVDDLRAFFESSSEVTAADFRRFTSAVLEREPSLTRLAWSEGDAGDPPAPVLATGAVAGDPLAGAGAAGVLAAARDGGETLLSPPLGPDGATAAMVAPVYAPGARPVTPALRRAALRGFVSATVSLDALGRGAAAGLPDGVDVRVEDAGPATGALAAPGIDVAGRHLVVALDGTGGPSRLVPVAVALGGLLLAGVVALLFLESGARERSARGELERLRVRHDLILSSAGDGIVSTGPDGRAGFVNPAAARMLGRTAEDLAGEPLGPTGLPSPEGALGRGRPESGETEIVRPDGSRFPAEFTTTPIVEGSGSAGAVITFRDISARKRLEARTLESLAAAEEMAAVDPLTDLANHRTFHERLNAEVDRARRSGRGVALVLMDLDHFKRVNDHHGHQTGDRVLAHAAQVFRAETRSGELVARVGGEEFAMILPDADGEEALRAAERVRRAVAATEFPVVGRMTISAGVCDLGQAEDADALYRLADGALYWAKHRGRDRVVRYTPDAAEPLSAREQADRLERQQALVSVRLLARVVDAKDPSTRRHSERVGDLCAEIAEELGWSTERAALLREAGLVHDVGKIGVPDAVLFAPRALTAEEWALVRDHAALGARIVSEALNPEQVAWVRSHHERWDGTGYPDGLLAEDCPEGARILALADAWDVMTSERPYSTTPATADDALAECRARAGDQFWPPAVEALARLRGAA